MSPTLLGGDQYEVHVAMGLSLGEIDREARRLTGAACTPLSLIAKPPGRLLPGGLSFRPTRSKVTPWTASSPRP